MKTFHRLAVCFFLLSLAACEFGCGSSDSQPKPKSDAPDAAPSAAPTAESKSDATTTTASAPATKSEAANASDAKADEPAKPFKLGDLIAPFTPPPLAEIDKTAEWINNPVLSGMEIMRKKQTALGPPPVSVEE